MEIRHTKVGEQRSFALDKGLRDALADHCRRRWPTNTAKHVARAYDLSVDEARGVVACRTSIATLERVFKVGGWGVALPVLAEVIGHAVDQFILRERRVHAEHAERLGALVGGWWPLAAGRAVDPADAAGPRPERDGIATRRVGEGPAR